MFSLPLSSSNVSSVSSLKSSRKHHQTRSPRGIMTKAADVMREGNDLLRQRQRGEEEHEEEQTKTKSRREVLKILPSSGVALVATMAIGCTAQPSFAANASGEQKLSSIEEKELAKERRKAAVRAAAERAKETGVGGNAFSDSEYMVGEDHSPNAHSHHEEGRGVWSDGIALLHYKRARLCNISYQSQISLFFAPLSRRGASPPL